MQMKPKAEPNHPSTMVTASVVTATVATRQRFGLKRQKTKEEQAGEVNGTW